MRREFVFTRLVFEYPFLTHTVYNMLQVSAYAVVQRVANTCVRSSNKLSGQNQKIPVC